jgi:signal transduction histidine kinase/ActR/RegA family two-component response regulator
MTERARAALHERVLLLAPTRRDAAIAASLLRETGISCEPCSTFDDALRELARGAAVLILPEEAITPAHNERLARVLRDQPAWSDLPMLVLAYAGADSVASSEAMRTLGNVTLLERPLRAATLLSAVRTAMRARERQYQIRGYLAESARAEQSLRLADLRKDEFLATLGHELRNPLAPLLSGVQLLRLEGFEDARVLKILAVMERQIAHLVRLVDDLLEVSRITRGLIDVRRDPLDLASVVRAALDTSGPGLEAAGHAVEIDLPETPLPVVGDAVRLTQVFANLLANAAKYTHNGGRIRVTARREGNRAIVSVRDNGIGIAAPHLGSVFDMFMQVDRSNRSSQGGLGIGLTLVRSLVEMHGGKVRALSEGVGKGSEFVVELPRFEQTFTGGERPAPLREFPNRRILVVDDNRDAAETLGALLEALGATVSIVHSGRSALERLDRFDPDTVLLDIGMAEMDGYEVARRVRAMPAHADKLLIALTGWGQEQDYSRSRAAGFDHHLIKPPNIDKLRELLTRNSGNVERHPSFSSATPSRRSPREKA